MDDPTTYLNHLPFFPLDPFFGDAAPCDRVNISVAISSIVQLMMKGCRKYRRLDPIPQSSTDIRSHLVLFQCFALLLHLITLSLSMREGSSSFPTCFVFFVTCSILCFHVCKTTQLSLYTLTRNTSLPPNHLSPRLHTTYSPLPCIINHERQYMFIHRHLTVRILDGVIREAVIYVHPI